MLLSRDVGTQDGVEAVSVGRSAYETIRRSIVEMRLPPGTPLTEREMMALTGASRSTVREAVKRLEGDRLVEVTGYNKLSVSRIDRETASDLYELRGVLDGLVVHQFCQHATERDRRELRRAFSAYEAAETGLSRTQAKDRFYVVLSRHSPAASEVLGTLNARISLFRVISLSRAGRHAESCLEISAMLDAIDSGDAAKARELSAAHAESAKRVVLAALAEMPVTSLGVLGTNPSGDLFR